jgi:protein-L-isoaspartate(D-aspartate) O-methyltransferase
MVDHQLRARRIRDPAVLDAMGRVPRERFVPPSLLQRAYEDGALGIGHGQTISQPYIVARMTEALELSAWQATHPDERPDVLDVGTGSGYQAAVLAAIGGRVTSIEQDPDLAKEARRRLAELGFEVNVVVGDGGVGWRPAAPYVGIVVAAAVGYVPEPLIDQLADGGRVVAPVGNRMQQTLKVVQRVGDGRRERSLEPCVFVPLLGRYGLPEDFY